MFSSDITSKLIPDTMSNLMYDVTEIQQRYELLFAKQKLLNSILNSNDGADIFIFNKDIENNLVMLVKVKALVIDEANSKDLKQDILSKFRLDIKPDLQNKNNKEEVVFIMLADLANIEIRRLYNDNSLELIISFKTADILQEYDPEFSHKRIFNFYLKTLIEAWVRDLAHNWKLESPPGSQELETIGLLEKIQGGYTYSRNDY